MVDKDRPNFHYVELIGIGMVARKEKIVSSRVDATRAIVKAIGQVRKKRRF